MPHRIFIAEDDPDDIYLLGMAFKEAGYQVELHNFEHGGKLMESLAKAYPHAMPTLIMLDLNLPVLDGKNALQAIKAQEALRTIPVIVYTTSKSEKDITEVYALGANSYIVKSPDYSEQVRKIRSFCDYWLNTVQLRVQE